MNASNSLSSSAALFGGAIDTRSRPAPAPLPRPLPRIEPNFLLWLQRDVRVQKKKKKGGGGSSINSHHGRLSFGLRLTESIQKWWLLDSTKQRRSRCAGTSRRPIIKIDGKGLTFEYDFRIGNKGESVFTPFAKTPSNCFFARVASADVSNEMIATPDERPLRSY
jgi:hypothetical protein